MNFVFKIDLFFRFTVYEKTVINQDLLVRLVKPTLGEEKKHYIDQTFLFKNKQTNKQANYMEMYSQAQFEMLG